MERQTGVVVVGACPFVCSKKFTIRKNEKVLGKIPHCIVQYSRSKSRTQRD
jgi:hypothetical protein